MKLLRYGILGSERPGILDRAGRIRDLSERISDVGPSVLPTHSLRRLREIGLDDLPIVSEAVCIGPCVSSVGKFICIGLNYSDHAADSGMPVPAEPVVFMGTYTVEAGNAMPQSKFLDRGILTLAEDAECLGGQLYRKGDRAGALRALVLVYHLWKCYAPLFADQRRWKGSIPGDLGTLVCRALNEAASPGKGVTFFYEGIEEVGKELETGVGVKRFISAG
jgi:hypothetical protein